MLNCSNIRWLICLHLPQPFYTSFSIQDNLFICCLRCGVEPIRKTPVSSQVLLAYRTRETFKNVS